MVLKCDLDIAEVSNANRVTSLRPQTQGNRIKVSHDELLRMRDDFWRIAPRRDGGRTEIWEALREAAECNDLDRKQQIIDTNNIRLGNRDMSLCFDDSGHEYKLPGYVLSDLADMNEDLRANKCGCSIV